MGPSGPMPGGGMGPGTIGGGGGIWGAALFLTKRERTTGSGGFE